MTYIIDNADEMGSAQQTHHNDSNQRTSSSSASDKSAVINKHRHPEKGAREVQKAASKKTSREVRKAVFKKPIDTEPNQALQEFRRKWHAVSKKKPDQMKLEQFWPVVIEDIFNSPLVQSIRSTHANLEKISNSVWEDIETASSVEDQAG